MRRYFFKKKLILICISVCVAIFIYIEFSYSSPICYSYNYIQSFERGLFLNKYKLYRSVFFERNNYLKLSSEPFVERCCTKNGLLGRIKEQNENAQLLIFYDSISANYSYNWTILLNDSIELFHDINHKRFYIIYNKDYLTIDSFDLAIYKYPNDKRNNAFKVGSVTYKINPLR